MRQNILSTLTQRIWNSPVLNTWASLAVKMLGHLVIASIVLVEYSSDQAAVYFLFLAIIGLQLVADMGFSTVFPRFIAYAMGGASSILNANQNSDACTPNYELIKQIDLTTKNMYLVLAAAWFLLLCSFGSLSLVSTISNTTTPEECWLSWGIVVLTSSYRLYGMRYTSYLIGINEISILKRWETLIGLLSVISGVCAVIFGFQMLQLVFVTQIWSIVSVIANRALVRKSQIYKQTAGLNVRQNNDIFPAVWKSAWRSSIGILMSAGIFQGSIIYIAQKQPAAIAASFLFSMNLVKAITQFSMVPFYTKLPTLTQQYANNSDSFIKNAIKGMSYSYWSITLPVIAISISGEYLLNLVESKSGLVNSELWLLLGIATFIERYGGLHIQLYSITNHIIWHIANGITGVIFLTCLFITLPTLGLYSLPLSQLISCLLFYCWYAARHSYDTYNLTAVVFEAKTSLLPAFILIIYSIARVVVV